MTMKRILSTISLAVAVMLLAQIAARAQERIGISCADCPSYSGAFSIENATGVTIRYQVRWGNQHKWQPMVLESGHIKTHSYPLGENPNKAVPIPYVRFDRIGGDNSVTVQEYRVRFHAVGYAGYGPRENKTEPKRYVFRFSAGGRLLELYAM
jgi:hypothetical protein